MVPGAVANVVHEARSDLVTGAFELTYRGVLPCSGAFEVDARCAGLRSLDRWRSEGELLVDAGSGAWPLRDNSDWFSRELQV